MFYTFKDLTSIGSHYIPYDYIGEIALDVAMIADENGVSLETAIEESRDRITGNDDGSYFCDTFKAELALVGNFSFITDAKEAGYIGDDCEIDPELIDIAIRSYLLDYRREAIIERARRE